MFGVGTVEIDAGNCSVGVFCEPRGDKAVQIKGDRSGGNRFVPGGLVNSPRKKTRIKECLRVRIGTGELQTKYSELAPYLFEKPWTCGETADQEDELLQDREREFGWPDRVYMVTVLAGSKSLAIPLTASSTASTDGLKNLTTCALSAAVIVSGKKLWRLWD